MFLINKYSMCKNGTKKEVGQVGIFVYIAKHIRRIHLFVNTSHLQRSQEAMEFLKCKKMLIFISFFIKNSENGERKVAHA